MSILFQKIAKTFIGAALAVSLAGCATHTGTDALAGGAGGAALGAAIGSFSHHRAGEGALLGGALGAIGGAIVGNEQDRRDREYSYNRYDGYERPREYEYSDVSLRARSAASAAGVLRVSQLSKLWSAARWALRRL